jgi:phenylacetic acid degradation operon negative regulatory protein
MGMEWVRFHHPDISFTVVRRRAGIELLEMLEMASLFLSRGGWGLLSRSCYPNQAAYLNAASRLRKKGLIAKHSEGGRTPQLYLSDTGKTMLPDYFSPEKFWNRKWNGIWYMLVYDVPEADRKYRNVLRQFLKRMRMGCLQQSVWITPQDIRADLDDLAMAANVDAFAYLFEARTVLGLPSRQVVEDAWKVGRLYSLQLHYCSMMEHNIASLEKGEFNAEELAKLMHISLEAYHGAFAEDPLLPSALHPANYLGKRVFERHRSLFLLINERLQSLSSR